MEEIFYPQFNILISVLENHVSVAHEIGFRLSSIFSPVE